MKEINEINNNIPNPSYDIDNFPQPIMESMKNLVSKEFMDDVESRKIFPSTVAYMCYRYDRF
jgi:hypothetical protein